MKRTFHLQAVLNPSYPSEAKAIAVFNRLKALGHKPRDIVASALASYDGENVLVSNRTSMINPPSQYDDQVWDIEHLQKIFKTALLENNAVLLDEFQAHLISAIEARGIGVVKQEYESAKAGGGTSSTTKNFLAGIKNRQKEALE